MKTMKLLQMPLLLLLSFVLSSTTCFGQSLSNLFNKDNINKVVNAVTGANNHNTQNKAVCQPS